MQNREHHLHDLACQYLCSKAEAIVNHAIKDSPQKSIGKSIEEWIAKHIKHILNDTTASPSRVVFYGDETKIHSISHETEVAIEKKFADVLLSFDARFRASLHGMQKELFREFRGRCYLEVKTGEFNLGDTIRQIKGYRNSVAKGWAETNSRAGLYRRSIPVFQSWFFVSLDHITECDKKQLAASGIGHIQLGDEFRAFCESAKDTESKPDLLI